MPKFRVVVLAIVAVACSTGARGAPVRDLVSAATIALATFDVPTESRDVVDRVSDAAWHLDVAALYRLMPDAGATDGRRALELELTSDNGRRIIRHRAPGAASLGDVLDVRYDPARDREPDLGRYSISVAAMPLASGDYRMRLSSAIDTGRGDLGTLWRLLPDAMRFFERGASADKARRRFPRTAAFVERYIDARTAVTPLATGGGVSVELWLAAQREAVAADYPYLVRYVTRIAARTRSHFELEREDGTRLAAWQFRGTDGVHLGFATRDGCLRADDPEGGLVDLESPQHLRFVVSTSAAVLGVRTSIDAAHTDFRIDPRGASPEIAGRSNELPERVTVEGALFGIVPVAAIDAILPGTMEGSVRAILSTLLRGRDGRGVEVVTRSTEQSPVAHEISSTAVADVPATRLARHALRLAAVLIEANDAERGDLMRFARDFLARLAADVTSS